jgi:Uma2 family endonuclease
VYTETGFHIGENLRVPDVAVVTVERIPEAGEPDSYWPFAPDIAIEVISPSDDYEAVLAKTMEYLLAGTRQVWLLSPTAQNVSVYCSRTDVRVFGVGDEIDGGEVLPGFRCAVADFFALPARRS